MRFTFFLHSKSSFRFKKRQITIMFLVNFLNGKIDHRFFSYKRKKKKKREIFWSEKQKEKKNWGRRSLVFLSFFLGQEIFFNIFQLLKKMSQLLCCFKRSGNFLKKKNWREGEVWSGWGFLSNIPHHNYSMISRDIFHSSIGQNDTVFDAFTFLLFGIFVIFPCTFLPECI